MGPDEAGPSGTRKGLLALRSTGRLSHPALHLKRYRRGGLFITYSHELQPSLTTTAHGVLALAMLGQDASSAPGACGVARVAEGLRVVDRLGSSPP